MNLNDLDREDLLSLIASLREENTYLKQEVNFLKEQLEWLKRQLFGVRSMDLTCPEFFGKCQKAFPSSYSAFPAQYLFYSFRPRGLDWDREALTGFPSHTTRHTDPYHGGS